MSDAVNAYYRDLEAVAEEVYAVRGDIFEDPLKIHSLLLSMGFVLHRKHDLKPAPTFCFEDQLPADITQAEYDAWFSQSWLFKGVRVGPGIERG